MKSVLMRSILISFLIVLFICNLAFAETKTFIKEYTYQASEVDSKVSSRAIALEQVKRLLLEELGTYLESHTEIVNFQLTRDRITALTAGIVQAQVIKEKWDGEKYWLRAEVKADPDAVLKAVDSLRKDSHKNKELEDANKKAEAALKELQELRKELALAKGDKTKITRYDQAIKELSATDWFLKGLSLGREGKHNEAAIANTMAIEINPRYVSAYVNRSYAYGRLGKYAQAVEDSSKAIAMDPRNAFAYNNRAFAYSKLGNIRQVIADSNKAIEFDPKNSLAYANRGQVYGKLGDHQQALADSIKAIELDPHNAMAYNNLGAAHGSLGNYQKALGDYSKAIELDPQYSNAYVGRGITYIKLKIYDHALEDSIKAAEIDPQNASAYGLRGDVYLKLGDNEQAISNYKTAARMGHVGSQKFLKSKGINW